MRILAITLTLSLLGTIGCTTIQPKPAAVAPLQLQVKDAAEPLDLAQVQTQLAKFVEIVELLNQTKIADNGNTAAVKSTAKKSVPTEPVPPKLAEMVTAINNNLEQLDNAESEAQTVRQMLSMADEVSGNERNLFSALFDIIINQPDQKK